MIISKKNILFILPTLTSGGAERVILNIVKHLDRNRFNIFLAVVSTIDEVYLKEVPIDVAFIDLESSRLRYSIFKILYTMWKIRPNIVFSSLGHLNLLIAIFRFAIPKKIKFIARETTFLSITFHQYNLSTIRKYLFKNFYKKIDLIICQSLLMKEDLINNLNLPSSKIIIIKNPIDIKNIKKLMLMPLEFTMDDNFINIVAVGRLVHAKGFDLLINAIALMNNPSIRLIIVGSGPNYKKLKILADNLSLTSNNVYFAGYQKNPYNWIYKSSLFILSSRYEGFPNVVLEALACGKHVIATPAGGVNDLDRELGENKFLTVTKDISSESLMEAILGFINIKEGIANSKIDLKKYYVENILNDYYEIF